MASGGGMVWKIWAAGSVLLQGASCFIVRPTGPMRATNANRRLSSVAAEHGLPPPPTVPVVNAKQSAGVKEVGGPTVIKGDVGDWGESVQDSCLRAQLFSTDSRPVILFDGLCHFCDQNVNLFMALDGGNELTGSFRYAPLQGETGQAVLKSFGMDPEHFTTIVLVEKEHFYVKSEAIMRIALRLKQPIPVLARIASLLPLELKDGAYDFVSEHRHIFGQKDACRIPEDHEMDRFLD